MRIGYTFYKNEGRKITGINQVIKRVSEEILQMDTNNQYYSLENNYLNLPLKGVKEAPCFKDSETRQGMIRMMGSRYDIELIHSYFYAFDMLENRYKRVLTIYDIMPLTYEKNLLTEHFEGPLKRSAQVADKIIAVSEYTKQDIIKYYGVSEEKIEVIYLGPMSTNNYKKVEANAILKYGLRAGGYLLTVCTLARRKNVDGLINAFGDFKHKYNDSELKLVIVGRTSGDNVYNELIYKAAAACGNVIVLGYVDNDLLVELYQNCLAFTFVSLYEGFGLPIIEAMQYGKAVITSNITSMPEVGGDAAIYCNPYERESILEAIETVVFNEQERKKCEKMAVVQSKKFSYEITAIKTLEVYRSLGAK